ncbi:MAG: zinc ABC transporter substrate-binding protein [Bdellovibrionales bacterium]|nr:zinc ABC transporter substrate-binding protein [Bdellovibrionales bacterium]
MKGALGLCIAALLLGFNVGCRSQPAAQRDRLQVVVTTGMIADVVQAVSGDRADVRGLMGPGIDPHLYKPTRTDIAFLSQADVVFYNGLLLEGKMTDALIRTANAGKKVVAVTEKIPEEFLLEPDAFAGHHDPHVWMDPTAWIKAVTVIEQTLREVDPGNSTTYEANATELRDNLERLDRYAQQVLESVPSDRRVLVTAHDAFNYFGRRYGYEVMGIQGISTESEAGVLDISRLVELLVSRRIPAVFVESTVSDRNIRALIDGARARGQEVAIGAELYSDAMGAPGTYEGTYIGMIDHNVTAIARALGGTAPERGFSGRLAADAVAGNS